MIFVYFSWLLAGVLTLGMNVAVRGQVPSARSQGSWPPAEIAASAAKEVLPAETSAPAGETNELDRLVNEALRYLAQGQVKTAVPLFKQILRQDKRHRRALFGLGTCFVELRKYRDAEIVFKRMLEEYPDAFEALNNLAWMYATASDPAIRDGNKAVAYAQQAVLLSPNTLEIWNTLSEAYYVSGQYEKAQRAAEEAVRLSLASGAPKRIVENYRWQAEKCARAAQAMSLVE